MDCKSPYSANSNARRCEIRSQQKAIPVLPRLLSRRLVRAHSSLFSCCTWVKVRVRDITQLMHADAPETYFRVLVIHVLRECRFPRRPTPGCRPPPPFHISRKTPITQLMDACGRARDIFPRACYSCSLRECRFPRRPTPGCRPPAPFHISRKTPMWYRLRRPRRRR